MLDKLPLGGTIIMSTSAREYGQEQSSLDDEDHDGKVSMRSLPVCAIEDHAPLFQ